MEERKTPDTFIKFIKNPLESIMMQATKIDINGIPIKESYDYNRVGFKLNENDNLNFPLKRVKIMKIVKNTEESDIVKNFILYYMVLMDMPLEFKIFTQGENGSVGIVNVHGYVESINLNQNIESNTYNLEISVIDYN